MPFPVRTLSFKPATLSIAVLSAIAMSAGFSSAPAFAQSASTFQKTCNNIKYGVDKEKTPVVMASCLKKDNKTRQETAAAIRGFSNNEGRLTAGAGVSTFQKTCKDMKVEARDDHVHLTATCKKTSGEWVPTSTILYDVDNIDGKLRHRVPGNDKVVM